MKYQQIVRTISETPWAILPAKLAAIREFIATRADGQELTPAEVQAAIGGRQTKEVKTAGTVAILPLYGVLTPRADLMSQISGATSLERFGEAFIALVNHPDVDAVVLDVDSPGGSCDFVTETAALIRAARGKKPIVAVANATAGSAAYWIASQADEIVVTPSGEVGSIGVFGAHTDISVAQEKAGIKTTLISAGEFKTELSPFEPLSDDARAALQDRIDKRYAQFIGDVALGRGVSESKVTEDFGQGRMVLAADAVAAGMADRIDTLDATVDRLIAENATQNAGLSGASGRSYSSLQTELLRAGLTEPDRELPPGYGRTIATNTTNLGAERRLSFADEAASARDVVASLIDRTRSLAEVRRGRLTAAKREQLLAVHDQVAELALAIDEVLAQTDPHRFVDLSSVEVALIEVGSTLNEGATHA